MHSHRNSNRLNFGHDVVWLMFLACLQNNDTLLNLDLSWNGVGTDGAKQLGEGLDGNKFLAVLSLNGARLNVESLLGMLSNMKQNTVLKALQVSASCARACV